MVRSSFLLLLGVAVFATAATPSYKAGFVTMDAQIASMGTLTFGPDGILFVGDQIGGTIWALDTGDTAVATPDKVSLDDIEGLVGSLIGADPDDVLVHDMAVNPLSRNTYISVSRARKAWNSPWTLPNDLAAADMLVKITPAGELSEVSLTPIPHSKFALPNPVAADKMNDWKKVKMRVDAVTDMAYADGKLYVAGLSNEEFSSSMNIIPFPFGEAKDATGLEVFHGAHGKYETHSPVRAFVPTTVGGKPHILAAYLCTPLAVFATDQLKAGAHVRGRTIAELGSGNYPLDMVPYKKDGKDYIFLINSNRAPMRFDASDLSTTEVDITTRAEAGTGMPFVHLRGQGMLQADRFSDDAVMVMVRGPHGKLDLGTLPARAL